MERRVILAIDDEKDNHEFIKSILEDDYIDVITALNGKEGFEKAKVERPDLIILDVQMPVMDGFEAFRHLKSEEKTNSIPIIMLTGIAEKRGIRFSKEEMGEFYGSEPDEYIEKPIDPDKLLKAVQKIIK
jgi:CheY-like chemotaxis protein